MNSLSSVFGPSLLSTDSWIFNDSMLISLVCFLLLIMGAVSCGIGSWSVSSGCGWP